MTKIITVPCSQKTSMGKGFETIYSHIYYLEAIPVEGKLKEKRLSTIKEKINLDLDKIEREKLRGHNVLVRREISPEIRTILPELVDKVRLYIISSMPILIKKKICFAVFGVESIIVTN